MRPVLSDDDVANILAALRYWQRTTRQYERLASGHMEYGKHRAYDDDQLDDLCERINARTEPVK